MDKETEDLCYRLIAQKKILLMLLKKYLGSNDWDERYNILNHMVDYYKKTRVYDSQDSERKNVFDKYPAMPINFNDYDLSCEGILRLVGFIVDLISIVENLMIYIKNKRIESDKEVIRKVLLDDTCLLFQKITNKKTLGFPSQPLDDFIDKLLEINTNGRK